MLIFYILLLIVISNYDAFRSDVFQMSHFKQTYHSILHSIYIRYIFNVLVILHLYHYTLQRILYIDHLRINPRNRLLYAFDINQH
jgi:hypothetical protein